MIINSNHSSKSIQARVLQTLDNGLQFDLSTNHCKKFLKRHLNHNIKVVILYIDIDDSTKMSLSISETELASIIQIFSAEMSFVIWGYGGYVLKYIGDGLLAFFPAEYNGQIACINAMNCAKTMLYIIRNCINPVFKLYGLPEITARVGLVYGNALVVIFGKNLHTAHVDMVGVTINIAAKLTHIAKPNHILMSDSIYNTFPADYVIEKKESHFRNYNTIAKFHSQRRN